MNVTYGSCSWGCTGVCYYYDLPSNWDSGTSIGWGSGWGWGCGIGFTIGLCVINRFLGRLIYVG